MSIISLKVFILMCFEDLIMFVISIFIRGFPIHLGNRVLISLFNKSVAGLGSPAPIGVSLICNKARLIVLLYYNQGILDGMHHKFYACFHLSITLVLVGCDYGLFYV